jgi:hypothetical protein
MTIKHKHQIEVSIVWEGPTREGARPKEKERQARLRWREPGGARSSRRLGWVTQLEAERLRAEREADLRRGVEQPTSSRGLDVAEMLGLYVGSVDESPTSASHKGRVVVDCENIARHLGEFLVEAITGAHVTKYVALRSKERVLRARRKRSGEDDDAWAERRAAARIAEGGKPVSSTAIRNELATLRRAMKWAKDAGHTTTAAAPAPHRKAMRKDARPARKLTEAEAGRLIDAAGPHRTLVQVFAWSGRRPVAIFALRVRDCLRVIDDTLPRNDRQAFWSRDKADEGTGWGKLTEPAYEAIRQRVRELGPGSGDRLLWTKDNGKPWASTDWPKAFRWIALRAGVAGVVTYDLRKHACAQILAATKSAPEAILYSGHKTVEVFMRNYAYAVEGGEVPSSAIGWTRPALRLVEANNDGEE